MGDNSKVLDDISILAQMCRSTSDGPTLKIEETEIKNKLVEYDEEIEEIKAMDADDSYDTSAEMADRNIEIITKKVIQTINNDLKTKNAEMDALKEREAEYSNSLHALKRTRTSYEKYIASLKDRLTSATDDAVIERYNNIISSTESKMIKQDERIKEMEEKHSEVQTAMDQLHSEITSLEGRLETKKTLLAEAQNNLQNKDLYIDKAKKEKTTKRIEEIEAKKNELSKRLEEISKDPKYLEMRIKEVITDGSDNFSARGYIVDLLTLASKVPYADQYVDKRLEEELLEATQQRDTFAGEIDSKTYDMMESISPEQIRVEFLNNRISFWQSEIKKLEEKVSRIDKDEAFHYAEKNSTLDELITKLKEETQDFKTRYEKEPDSNLSNKAILKITYEEKKADLAAAEEISSKFRKNEAEDVEEAGRIVKQDIADLNKKVAEAEEEIYQIKERLDNRKSGNKDLSAKNRDREKLEKLAQVVIDIKHRRQFADRAFDIAKRLEFNLGMKLVDAVYNEEDQDRLSKEVIVPVEEPIVEEPIAMETGEQTIEEDVANEEATTETTEETPVEVAVAEPAQELSVEDAINEIPSEENPSTETSPKTTEAVTSEVNVEEVPATEEEKITNEVAPIAEPSNEQTVGEPVTDAPVSIEEQAVVDNNAPSTEKSISTEEQDDSANQNVAVESDLAVDFSIPELTIPTEVESETVSSNQIDATIPEAAPAEEPEITNSEEIAIPDMPPLPAISSDDTTSIPVIPIAEPSTDDNYTFNSANNEEQINSEMSPFPRPEDLSSSESESETE